MTREPTAIISAIGALLASLAKVAVLLNLVEWDAEQLAGITLVIDNFLLVLGALFIRSLVTPSAAPRLEAGTPVNVTDAHGATLGHAPVPTPVPDDH